MFSQSLLYCGQIKRLSPARLLEHFVGFTCLKSSCVSVDSGSTCVDCSFLWSMPLCMGKCLFKLLTCLVFFRRLLRSQNKEFLYTLPFLKVITFSLMNYTSIFEIWPKHLELHFFCFLNEWFWTGILMCCRTYFAAQFSASALKLVMLWGVWLLNVTACHRTIRRASGQCIDMAGSWVQEVAVEGK